MKHSTYKILFAAVTSLLILSSCHKKLELKASNAFTDEEVYSTSAGYRQSLAKVYGAMALTGNAGGAGSPDIPSQIISD